ncbi:MAG: hypothetical protein IPI49_29200, partial [Myxococcales bacterium]|nr:hypothetical protein [Myxococcales bacterium]
VVVAEQVEDPKLAKGLVRRAVVRIITPGVFLDEEALDPRTARYVAAVAREPRGSVYGLSYLDVTTGEFRATTLGPDALADELLRVAPREVIAAAAELAPGAPAARCCAGWRWRPRRSSCPRRRRRRRRSGRCSIRRTAWRRSGRRTGRPRRLASRPPRRRGQGPGRAAALRPRQSLGPRASPAVLTAPAPPTPPPSTGRKTRTWRCAPPPPCWPTPSRPSQVAPCRWCGCRSTSQATPWASMRPRSLTSSWWRR